MKATSGSANDGAVSVAAGVIRAGDRVVVCRRRAHDPHPGKWEFPGGKVEAGETLVECLRRELCEELGIEAAIGRVLWETRYQYAGHRPLVLTFLEITSYSGALSNRCFAEVRWATPGELLDLDFLEADREFVARFGVR